jgi:hypothetical protein
MDIRLFNELYEIKFWFPEWRGFHWATAQSEWQEWGYLYIWRLVLGYIEIRKVSHKFS